MNSSARFYATDRRRRPGDNWLLGAVDGHIHACPHINDRCLDVFQAVRDAAEAGMRCIGLMDNFVNSSGIAALANRELSHLGVYVFGGLIMEPPAGGVSADAVRIALNYGYSKNDGARFISFPTHHTRHVATLENRPRDYVERCFSIPDTGPLAEDVIEIIDLIAQADVVLNTGHLSPREALRLVSVARERGVNRILAPANHFDEETVKKLCALGAFVEFSFFFISHATEASLTHVDSERHRVSRVPATQMVRLIASAPEQQVILSSDCGVSLLPPPVEGLREFLVLMHNCAGEALPLQRMVRENPTALFGLPPTPDNDENKSAEHRTSND